MGKIQSHIPRDEAAMKMRTCLTCRRPFLAEKMMFICAPCKLTDAFGTAPSMVLVSGSKRRGA